ncbi:hypothetical protein ABT282_07835 [Streptomyces sp. NPDC000927]|uniref:hypothetical protein n=1 Tax=Streptomyces sp. NPDC000927 TaxID=3154371 RepID=UPI003322ABB4
MTTDLTPTVEIAPRKVILDVTALTRLIVSDIIDTLLKPGDTREWDLLHQIADPDRLTNGQNIRERLEQELADQSTSRITMPHSKARALAEQISLASGSIKMPHQRNPEAA